MRKLWKGEWRLFGKSNYLTNTGRKTHDARHTTHDKLRISNGNCVVCQAFLALYREYCTLRRYFTSHKNAFLLCTSTLQLEENKTYLFLS